MKNAKSGNLKMLSTIEGLRLGWALFHKVPLAELGKEFETELHNLFKSFRLPAEARAETFAYDEFSNLVLAEFQSTIRNMKKLMSQTTSMDAVSAGRCLSEDIVLAQKFMLISFEEALEIHQAGHASYNIMPIGKTRRGEYLPLAA